MDNIEMRRACKAGRAVAYGKGDPEEGNTDMKKLILMLACAAIPMAAVAADTPTAAKKVASATTTASPAPEASPSPVASPAAKPKAKAKAKKTTPAPKASPSPAAK
jgi:hypothetical protein